MPRGPFEHKSTPGSYGQFCPIAMAAEIICSRWTALVLREMPCGTTRFNDLRRGVPRMSPTLLSKREGVDDAGVIRRHAIPAGRSSVPAHQSRRGPARHRHVARRLGTAMDQILAVAEESRFVAANVGHAAKPRTHRFVIVNAPLSSLSRAERCPKNLFDSDRRQRRRPLRRRPRLRSRSLRTQCAAQHDFGLDGRLDAESRDRRRKNRVDRRQDRCALDESSGLA